MMADQQGRDTLRRRTLELLALENDIGAELGDQCQAMCAFPDVANTVARFLAMIEEQRDALRSYLENRGEVTDATVSGVRGFVGRKPHSQAVSDMLRSDYAAFTYAAISYAVLFELALRLYDPDLRELAPRHLSRYAEAAQTISQLIFDTVAGELVSDGLQCCCICPMCSIGACGCVSASSVTLNEAWSEAAPSGDVAPGFLIQPPRPGSPLALAGIRGGERLLKVDGQPVHSIVEIQSAIRKHSLGDDVRLLLQRGSMEAKEIQVKHVGDYPQE